MPPVLDKEVVVTYKNGRLPREVGIVDYEKGRADKLTDFVWLTDDTISRGSWCYTENLGIKKSLEIVRTLADIVSKNGQLMLNISPKADGTIPDNQKKVLLEIGDWMKQIGEAIYGTRPFVEYGEGPAKMESGGMFAKMKGGYSAKGYSLYPQRQYRLRDSPRLAGRKYAGHDDDVRQRRQS